MTAYNVFEGKHRNDRDDITTAVGYAELARQLSYAADAAIYGNIEASNRNKSLDDIIQDSLHFDPINREKFRLFVKDCGPGWNVELLQKFYHHLTTPLRLIQRELAESLSLQNKQLKTDQYVHEAFFHNNHSSVNDLIDAIFPQPSDAGGW